MSHIYKLKASNVLFPYPWFFISCIYILYFTSFSSKKYKFTAVCISLLFSILCSFRFVGVGVGVGVGWELFGGIDAHGYKIIYQNVSGHGFLETFILQPWEYGFSFLYWVSSSIGISFEVF